MTRLLRRALLVSAVLHAAAALTLLVLPALFERDQPEPAPQMAQVELVMQQTPNVGAEASRRTQAPQPQPQQAAPPPAPAEPTAAAEPTPQPPPTPAPTQEAKIQTAPDPKPDTPPEAVRLGQDDAPGTGLVSGSQVIPASADTAFRNKPPPYPAEAARLGLQGTVGLMIHVNPDGAAAAVEVAESSGSPILDKAAHDAIARWHFHPAQQDGAPVPSVLPLNIRFLIGDK